MFERIFPSLSFSDPTANAVEEVARRRWAEGTTGCVAMSVPRIPPSAARLLFDAASSLEQSHFDLGGMQINLNILDAGKVLEGHQDPSKYPDLVVRVTGFSAYFASLSPMFRQLVVDRIIRGCETDLADRPGSQS